MVDKIDFWTVRIGNDVYSMENTYQGSTDIGNITGLIGKHLNHYIDKHEPENEVCIRIKKIKIGD